MTPHEKIPDSYEFAVEVWEVIKVAELQVVITGENQTRSSAAHFRVQCTSGGNLKNREKKKGKKKRCIGNEKKKNPIGER